MDFAWMCLPQPCPCHCCAALNNSDEIRSPLASWLTPSGSDECLYSHFGPLSVANKEIIKEVRRPTVNHQRGRWGVEEEPGVKAGALSRVPQGLHYVGCRLQELSSPGRPTVCLFPIFTLISHDFLLFLSSLDILRPSSPGISPVIP